MRLLAALLMAGSVWFWFPPTRGSRRHGESGRRSTGVRHAGLRRVSPVLACAVAGLSAVALLPSPLGLVGGVLIVGVGPALLRRLQSRAERNRRIGLARQAPEAAELLAALVAGGASPGVSLEAVTGALGEPLASAVAPTMRLLDLGATPEHAWQSMIDEPALAPIGAAFRRSSTSGAPLARVLSGVARDLRRRHLLTVQTAARSAGVSAVVPLAVCFLPAFLLLGVTPVVASLALNLVQR